MGSLAFESFPVCLLPEFVAPVLIERLCELSMGSSARSSAGPGNCFPASGCCSGCLGAAVAQKVPGTVLVELGFGHLAGGSWNGIRVGHKPNSFLVGVPSLATRTGIGLFVVLFPTVDHFSIVLVVAVVGHTVVGFRSD